MMAGKRGCTGQEAAWKEDPKVWDWGYARENVYPILMPAGNENPLGETVHTMLLDLAVAYAIRGGTHGEGGGTLTVDASLLESYGVSREELHRQALKNMDRDGYCFRRLEEILFGIPGLRIEEGPGEAVRIYVLTNRDGRYGAAGLLDQEKVKEFAGGCDYYILPASIHELLFVPAGDIEDPGQLDGIVEEVSLMAVAEEERLSYHSYFYDAASGGVRLCR